MAKILAEARAEVARGDNALALFIVRDSPAVKEAGLEELVWSYWSQGSCGYVPPDEIGYILSRLSEVREVPEKSR